MSVLNNVKIGVKLIGSFIAVALVIVVVAVVGYVNMKDINDGVTAMYVDNLLPIQYLGNAQSTILTLRGDALQFVLAPQDRNTKEKEMALDMENVNKAMDKYRVTPLSDDEKNWLAGFDTSWADYQAALADVVKQVKAGNELAAAQSMREGGPAANAGKALFAATSNLIEISVNDSAQVAIKGTSTFAGANALAAASGIIGTLLAALLGIALSNSITTPLAQTVNMIQRIGKGDLQMRLNLRRKDEIGILARTMDKLADDLQNMLNGNLRKLAEGDLNVEIQFFDAQDEIARAEQKIVSVIQNLVTQVNQLTQAAIEGKLATRADADKFQGDYRRVIQGINDTLDAIVGPLNVSAQYVDRISKGDIPAKITDDYQGEFGEIKTNLNNLIDAQNMRNHDLEMLIQAALEGKLDTRADTRKYVGANGTLVEGVNSVLNAIVTPIKETSQILAQIAQGNLTATLNGNFRGDYAMLKNSIETMLDGLKDSAGQTQESAASVTSAAAQILTSSSQMALTTREQASAVNEITSTAQEIKSSAEQVAQRAQDVAEQANRASQAAQHGTESVGAAMNGMDDIRTKVEAIAENILALSEKTQQIGDIIDTVSDIAGQSNILALNAAIEASQAGEAGKGFRVVADEVRSLSEQSRQAAAQVKVILGDIQKATNLAVMATEQGTRGVNTGSQLVAEMAQTINDLGKVVERSAQAAQQIVAGVEQQTIGLDQIVMRMHEINQAARQSAMRAQQSQKAAQNLTDLAARLRATAMRYRLA